MVEIYWYLTIIVVAAYISWELRPTPEHRRRGSNPMPPQSELKPPAPPNSPLETLQPYQMKWVNEEDALLRIWSEEAAQKRILEKEFWRGAGKLHITEIKKMNCPECGAPAQHHTCDYCGSAL